MASLTHWSHRSTFPDRLGFTLLELTVVLAVLGVVGIVATSMLHGSRVIQSLEARQEAQHLGAALRSARAGAIAEATPVRLQVLREGRSVVGFQTLADRTGVLQPQHRFGPRQDVEWSSPEIVFMPTGMSDRSLTVTITGENSTWVVEVLSASGQVSITRTR